ncbi:hypothetical protein Smp_178330 [Schistosoma mansoni]|uniref:hypothetical protein n=1 Tax=Schistosoma mansoni TaxID=6183 RepID=UPI00022C8230|nr:hypothetical protein Smp_178330 [Schistosoma mansoni]|eukprot:XP_018644448.1 hypothetical protein Smp_178330 [Schistosoma mansoni]
MFTQKNHKADQIPDLSPYYLETHTDGQLEGNGHRINPLLELELAEVRLAQTEKEMSRIGYVKEEENIIVKLWLTRCCRTSLYLPHVELVSLLEKTGHLKL